MKYWSSPLQMTKETLTLMHPVMHCCRNQMKVSATVPGRGIVGVWVHHHQHSVEVSALHHPVHHLKLSITAMVVAALYSSLPESRPPLSGRTMSLTMLVTFRMETFLTCRKLMWNQLQLKQRVSRLLKQTMLWRKTLE